MKAHTDSVSYRPDGAVAQRFWRLAAAQFNIGEKCCHADNPDSPLPLAYAYGAGLIAPASPPYKYGTASRFPSLGGGSARRAHAPVLPGPPLITRIGTLSENEPATVHHVVTAAPYVTHTVANLDGARCIAIGSETDSWLMGKRDDFEAFAPPEF